MVGNIIFLHIPCWIRKKFSRWCEKNINWQRDTLWYYCPLGPEVQLGEFLFCQILYLANFDKSLIVSCRRTLLCFRFQTDLWFVCFFVQFWRKEDWGEISICGAAEFMNYIVRPMNKQTLMCFNFAGTKINWDSHCVWIFSFEIKLLLKMDTTSTFSQALDGSNHHHHGPWFTGFQKGFLKVSILGTS